MNTCNSFIVILVVAAVIGGVLMMCNQNSVGVMNQGMNKGMNNQGSRSGSTIVQATPFL